MRESRTYGSMRGALGNGCPYRDRQLRHPYSNKRPAVKRWLCAHTRFHLHFTPTSASCLNMVERFSSITHNRIRRGVFKSVVDLKRAITDYHAGEVQR